MGLTSRLDGGQERVEFPCGGLLDKNKQDAKLWQRERQGWERDQVSGSTGLDLSGGE